MKKLLLSLLLATTILLPATNVSAQEITVIANGQIVNYDSAPVIENNTTLVPLRQTFEALDIDVDWNAKSKTITADKDGVTVVLTVGLTTAYKNGQPFEMSVAPQIINGRTYVPLRFVAESFGAQVNWDSGTKTASILSVYEAYDPNYVETEYVAYNTGSLDVLIDAIADGNVVVINGEYYATPEYATAMYHATNSNNVNPALSNGSYEEELAPEDYDWYSGYNFQKKDMPVYKLEELGIDYTKLEKSEIPDWYYIYGLFEPDGVTPIYLLPDMTDEFANAQNATGTFSGIHMMQEDGILFFSIPDLIRLGIFDF